MSSSSPPPLSSSPSPLPISAAPSASSPSPAVVTLARDYLRHHSVQEALESAVNSLLSAQPQNPFEFLSQHFHKLSEQYSHRIPHVIFVLGGPGAGKGTQCSNLVRDFGFIHLSAGDLLREARNAGDDTAKMIDHYIKEGKIVPVEVTVSLLRRSIESHCRSGNFKFLIDGFPRDEQNLSGWNAAMGNKAIVDFCLFFECSEDVMEQRLLKRGQHSGRTDDNIEAIKKRFKTYEESTKPIIKLFGTKGKLVTVDATKEKEEVYRDVQREIKERENDSMALNSNNSNGHSVNPSSPQPRVVFVLGGPGAGKGTQCVSIVKDYGFVHLSAGDLLREARLKGDDTASMIDSYIKEGKIVPVEVTVNLLKSAMIEATTKNKFNFLVDGFPRDEQNLKGWQKVMGDSAVVEFVLFFDCPESVMEERLLRRGEHSGRTDDNMEAIKKRFKTYVESTVPIIEYYEKEGKVKKIDSTRSVDDVYRDVRNVFSAYKW